MVIVIVIVIAIVIVIVIADTTLLQGGQISCSGPPPSLPKPILLKVKWRPLEPVKNITRSAHTNSKYRTGSAQ